MHIIQLSEAAACAANRTLNGARTELSDVLSQTQEQKAHGQSVAWQVPVTSQTVHRLEGLFTLAQREGVGFEPRVAGQMTERQLAFFEDFAFHSLHQDGGGLRRKVRLAAELAEELAFLALAMPNLLRSPRKLQLRNLKRVLIIGAYGGDHVGDAAILGGVLLALNRQYGVETATLLSHRAQHTRRLADGIQTPVALDVLHYDSPTGVRSVSKADAVVIAGGPMMDLPRVLVKHLAVAAEARRLKKPLIVERIGLGPFIRNTSRKASRLLLRQAAQISTRTSRSAKNEILAGLEVQVGRDPAFDYLETRKTLTLLTEEEKSSVDELLAGTEGRTLIGLNVRPIRHRWSSRGTAYAKTAEDQFIESAAEAMKRFSAAAASPVTFVFYPMNPIQYGMSDLTSAYRLLELVGTAADYRIWEADPDVDGVLYLLRRLDSSLAVRFHACIFAISQGLPTIGADYYPGGGGKVCELFADLGHTKDVRVMDEITPQWLSERFAAHGNTRNKLI